MANSKCIEVWRPVVGYQGWYSISNHGRVRRDSSYGTGQVGKILRPNSRSGYFYVNLCKGHGRQVHAVHHLVLFAFVGPGAPKHEARHLNGCRTDNRPSNLAWGTHKQNGEDTVCYGGYPCGESHRNARLTNKAIKQIRAKYATGHYTQESLATEYGVTHRTIGRAICRESWNHVE